MYFNDQNVLGSSGVIGIIDTIGLPKTAFLGIYQDRIPSYQQ